MIPSGWIHLRLQVVDYYEDEAEHHYLKTLTELLRGAALDASVEDFYEET